MYTLNVYRFVILSSPDSALHLLQQASTEFEMNTDAYAYLFVHFDVHLEAEKFVKYRKGMLIVFYLFEKSIYVL